MTQTAKGVSGMDARQYRALQYLLDALGTICVLSLAVPTLLAIVIGPRSWMLFLLAACPVSLGLAWLLSGVGDRYLAKPVPGEILRYEATSHGSSVDLKDWNSVDDFEAQMRKQTSVPTTFHYFVVVRSDEDRRNIHRIPLSGEAIRALHSSGATHFDPRLLPASEE